MRGDRLKKLREQSGITQADLAERLDISTIQILRHEQGSAEPRADLVVKYAEFFNVSTDYLLGVSDETGSYLSDNLHPKEARAISAWRRGEKYEAIKVIVEDE